MKIESQIQSLTEQVEAAITALQNGVVADLGQMQSRVQTLCQDIHKAGKTNPAEAVACKAAMATLISRLDALAEDLTAFKGRRT